jgi:hypothetical protein
MGLLHLLWTCLILPLLLMTGCGTLYKEANSANELTSDTVIIVGRIALVPTLGAKEQDIEMGLAPFGAKDYYVNRVMLYLSREPPHGERTSEVMNPVLEKTFFILVPKDRRYMVEGVVLMQHRQQRTSLDTTELLIPPIEFDIQPKDKAIYVGTLQFHRDEFNEVIKTLVLDNYDKVYEEFRRKFGGRIVLRKALVKPLATRK